MTVNLLHAPVVEPGFYEMDEGLYHADPCPTPSLNHTIARLLITRSPKHAHLAHPRLGGVSREATSEMLIGAAAHTLVLGRGRLPRLVEFPNYRTKAAQEARDLILADGGIPLLEDDYRAAHEMAYAAVPVLRSLVSTRSLTEVKLFARDGDTWLRGMADALSESLATLVDYKTVETLDLDRCDAAVRTTYATQAAFYLDLVNRLEPDKTGRRRFLYLFQERQPPYDIALFEPDPALLEIATAQIARARTKWAECVASNVWPGVDIGPHMVAPRQWEIDAEMDRQYEDKIQAAAE